MGKVNRRNFFKKSSLYAGGLMTYTDMFKLINMIVLSTIEKAHAQVSGSIPKNYLSIHLGGGPSRFLFDQFLTPNLTDPVLSLSDPTYWNDGVTTAFNNNVLEHRLMTYNGVRVPHHYQYPVITSKGSVLPTQLLNHMGVIRGYSSGTDGHEVNNPIQAYPDPAAPSLHAVTADYRKDLISAVDYNGRMPFASSAGKVASIITNHNGVGGSIGGLINVFKKYVPQSSLINNIDQLSGARNYFKDVLKATLQNYDKTTANAIKDHMASGETLIQFAAEDLNTIWNTLYLKYKDSIDKSSQIVDGPNGPIPFLTDNPVKLLMTEPNITDDFSIDRNFDLREAFKTSSGAFVETGFARILALYEYCLTRGITGVLGGEVGTTVANIKLIESGGTTLVNKSIGNDQHNTPPRLNVLGSAMMYRGMMGGLLELVDFLKTKQFNGQDLFSQTVIHITGDFSRSPRTDKIGYDHGWDAQVTSVISGAIINGPIVVGNIKRSGRSGYNGTWGIGEKVDFNGSKEVLSVRHVAAAVANLLNAPNPWIFTHKVWELQNNVLVPKITPNII